MFAVALDAVGLARAEQFEHESFKLPLNLRDRHRPPTTVRTIGGVCLDDLTDREILVFVGDNALVQEVAQAVAFSQERIDNAALTRRHSEITAGFRNLAQHLLRTEQRPIQNAAALLANQERTEIRNLLRRRRRFVAHDVQSALPRADVTLKPDLQPRVRRDQHVKRTLQLKAASAAFLFSVEPIAADQAFQN